MIKVDQHSAKTTKMDIGSKLKFFRIQRNLKQEDLARGIISVSYLSKIENNLTSPSEEVLQLLCERLGVSLIEQQDDTILSELIAWYKLMMTSNGDEIRHSYEELGRKIQTANTKTYMYFVLFELRYHLYLQDLEQAKLLIHKLQQFNDIFDLQMHYYFEKFYAIFSYRLNNYADALKHLKVAEKLLQRNTNFDSSEEADLFYLFGLTYSQTTKVPLSITYTTKALHIFQAIYDLKRSAECQVLLGICYRRIGEYDRSEESYLLAQKLSESLNNKYLQALIFHNLGKLYSIQRLHPQAIEEFEKSYYLKEDRGLDSKLNSIYCLLMEYDNMEDSTQCRKWLEIGKSLLTSPDELVEYHYYFTIFDYVLADNMDELDVYFQEVVLPFFQQQDLKEPIIKYAERLAIYFESCYKYKKASYYYSLCYQELKKQTFLY
ncbi:helix-turn-helix transcriptional regulator [Sutcliffiella halmapala]|uniref:helix-turn-helix transcriptional regulator n=1 Tax=Sutcliffiella halmapala TaxID=79882 RepID=UPI001475E0A9|nr:helix-turn-helix transcriptional regulator [Sutcliffiella halmapala]